MFSLFSLEAETSPQYQVPTQYSSPFCRLRCPSSCVLESLHRARKARARYRHKQDRLSSQVSYATQHRAKGSESETRAGMYGRKFLQFLSSEFHMFSWNQDQYVEWLKPSEHYKNISYPRRFSQSKSTGTHEKAPHAIATFLISQKCHAR